MASQPIRYSEDGRVLDSFVERVEPRHGTPITFSHPNVQGGKALQIYGVNEILWGYNLITSVKATYGGQVIQVLGAYIGPLQVSGNTRSSAEQERIRRWFVDYMRSAGTGRRNQGHVTMRYPERGWELAIMPTNFGPWQLATEMVANEWAMQAEVVQPESNALSTHTMSQYTKPLSDPTFVAIAFDPNNPAINPSAPANTISQFENIGDNFDRLLAAMTTGNYGNFGYDPLRASDEQFKATADEQYEATWGDKYLVKPSGNSSSGSSGGSTGGEPSGKLQIVNNIVAEWESRDMPGRLGVAVCLLESNFLPDNWNGNYLGLFQTAPASQGGKTVSADHTGHMDDAYKAAKATGKTSLLPEGTITKHYPASEQIFDAAEWFKKAASGSSGRNKAQTDAQILMQWAMDAQGVNLSNNPLFGDIPSRFLPEADNLIKQAKAAGGGGSATIAGMSTDKTALISAIEKHARFHGNAASGGWDVEVIVLQGLLAIMNGGYDIAISSTRRHWGTTSLHEVGKAADLNNYGPGGAQRNAGGTSSANPANFVAFLKANREKLGNIKIGGGANDAEHRAWGTDFVDKNDHVHIQWPR